MTGKDLFNWRKEHHILQEEIAYKAQVHINSIRLFEQERVTPHKRTLEKIKQAISLYDKNL